MVALNGTKNITHRPPPTQNHPGPDMIKRFVKHDCFQKTKMAPSGTDVSLGSILKKPTSREYFSLEESKALVLFTKSARKRNNTDF